MYVKPPKEIEGKQALFVVNLPERKKAGELSQGMLFNIDYTDKISPCLAMPEVLLPIIAPEQDDYLSNQPFHHFSLRSLSSTVTLLLVYLLGINKELISA